MKTRIFNRLAGSLLLAFLFSISLPVFARAAEFPVMHPDRATRQKWQQAYDRAALASIDPRLMKIAAEPGSVDLLPHIYYIPSERDQGRCGNCWLWAGTGCLEVALSVQDATWDRLSIQYPNSCEFDVLGKRACEGGWLSDLADFYTITRMAIPWSNTNAYWQDGDGTYHTPHGTAIAKYPNYPIDRIVHEKVTTYGLPQAQAIQNIKNVLNQGRAVFFGFFMPDSAAWRNFYDFWLEDSEDKTYQIDKYRGIPYDEMTGAGHGVVCVGYDDTDPNDPYWVMLNSWGNSSPGRPNVLFRINMDMDYSASNEPQQSFFWQTLDMDYGLNLNSFVMRDKTSGSTAYTHDRQVRVELADNGDPAEVGLALYPDMTGAVWLPYQKSLTYDLPAGDGPKTVYARLRDADARESNTLGSAITLAEVSPQASFFLNYVPARDNDYIAAQPVLTVTWSGAAPLDEPTLLIKCDNTTVSDGTAGGGRYDSYDPTTKTLRYAFRSPLALGSHNIAVSATDLAGNSAAAQLSGLTVCADLAVASLINSPNPFSSETKISYVLSRDAAVSIGIFDLRGRLIKTLTASAGGLGGQAGYNSLTWTGNDQTDRPVPNGTYLYRLTASDGSGRRISRQNKLSVLR